MFVALVADNVGLDAAGKLDEDTSIYSRKGVIAAVDCGLNFPRCDLSKPDLAVAQKGGERV